MGVLLSAAVMGRVCIPTLSPSFPQHRGRAVDQHLVSHRTTNISQSPLQERLGKQGELGEKRAAIGWAFLVPLRTRAI